MQAWCGMYRGLSTLRIKQFKSVSCFRIVSSSIHRDALHACAARPNRAALCVCRAARCGERFERRRWRMKRDERVAAVKILSVRRKAAQKFWAPQQGHRPLRILRGQGRPPLQDAGDLTARTVRAIAGAFGSTPAIGWFRSISAACDGCRQHPDPSGLSRDPSPGT